MRLAFACLLLASCYLDDPPGSAPTPAPDAGAPVARQRPRDPRRPPAPAGGGLDARERGAEAEHVQRSARP